MNKRILIIGANSVLAQEIIPYLKRNNTIVTAGRSDCDIYCDVTKEVDIPQDIDVIVNCAAAFAENSDEDILTTQNTNSLGALNICIAAKKANVDHIVMISSLSAVLDQESPYYSAYSITKKHADELSSYYCKINDVPLTILRPSQIFGKSEEFAKHQPLFYRIINKAQKGEDVLIYGENDALRNYIHCEDIAEIINRTIAQQVVGIYSCAHPVNVSYSQIAHTAQKVFNKGGEVVFQKDKANIPDNVFTESLNIYQDIDFLPKVDLDTGIRKIKEHREGLT